MNTTIGNIDLKIPIYNAAGVHCITHNELDYLNKLDYCGAIITKSCTLNPRTGNNHPRYWSDDNYSINSSGLPNKGYAYYSDWINKTNLNKHCFLSTAPTTYIEFNEILNSIAKSNWINYPEINLSCPNLKTNIYNIKTLEEYLRKTSEIIDCNYGLKMPALLDSCMFDKYSDIIKHHPKISYITCINSIPNGLYIDVATNTTRILPNSGLGGIGGSPCLPVALSNVYNFKQRLPNLDIVGCGGIYSGKDVLQHILAGASAVQIGTCLYNEGPICFKKIHNELQELMKTYNYKNIKNIIGTVKNISL